MNLSIYIYATKACYIIQNEYHKYKCKNKKDGPEKITKNKSQKEQQLLDYNDFELNSSEYKEA